MTFDFFLSPEFVQGYCAVIVLGLIGFIWHLNRQTRNLKRRLRGAQDRLRSTEPDGGEAEAVAHRRNEFAKQFEEHDRVYSEDFGLPWKEFVETLVLPEPGSDEPIRNTREVSRDLNDQTIVFPEISAAWHLSVPNLLTGVGILGTFIGLAAGVGAASSGLTSGDSETITRSLLQLLDGAALAFFTSIAGIASSLIFLIWERVVSRQCHVALDRWVMALESCLLRVTMEDLALRNLRQAEQTTTQLKKFNTDLIFSIEQALEEKVAGRLAPQLDQILEAFKSFRADRSTDSAAVIGDAIEKFTAALHDQAGSQFDKLEATVKGLDQALKDSSEELAETQRSAQAAIHSMLDGVNQSMTANTEAASETMREAMNRFGAALSSGSEHLAKDLAAAGRSAASQIGDSLGGLESAAARLERATQQSEQVLTEMNRFVEQVEALRGSIQKTHQEIAAIAQPVERAARGMNESGAEMAAALQQSSSLVARLEASASAFQEHEQRVAAAWTQYQDRFEGIDRALGGVFQQMDDGLARYCEQVRNFANELDKTTANCVQQLASATTELNHSIEDLMESLPRPSR